MLSQYYYPTILVRGIPEPRIQFQNIRQLNKRAKLFILYFTFAGTTNIGEPQVVYKYPPKS